MRAPALVAALVCLALSVGLCEDAFAQELEINDRTVPEGNTGPVDVTLTVTLSDEEEVTGIVTVDYVAENVAAPTATGGATCDGTTDYIIETGTLQFAVGQVSQSVGITVCGDAVVESDEAFRVRLRNASGATIEDANGRVTLTNDDAAAALPTLSINDVTAPEGNTGTTARQFTVTLSAASSQTVTVLFGFRIPSTNGVALGTPCGAAGIDVTLATGTLTFAPSVTTQAIPFTVCGDVLDESDEIFDVVLGDTPAGATIADQFGRGTITDDDLATALPSLSVSDGTTVEGTTGINFTQHMQFTVTLSAASTQRVGVTIATTRTGSAELGATCGPNLKTDLQVLQAPITFDPGTRSLPLGVTICGDARDESDETFNIVLSGPTGATIADGTGRGTIIDDDLP